MARVIVITGPSGVGKGTLIRGMRERVPGIELSVSATTRPPRPGEADGVDYHFLTKDEFERRVAAGEFVEHATYSGHRYGTLRSELEERLSGAPAVVLEIEVQGARQIPAALPEALQVFIAPPSLEALRGAVDRPRDGRSGGRGRAAGSRARGAGRARRVRPRRGQRPSRGRGLGADGRRRGRDRGVGGGGAARRGGLGPRTAGRHELQATRKELR